MLALVCCVAVAAYTSEPHVVYLNTGNIDTRTAHSVSHFTARNAASEPQQYVVHVHAASFSVRQRLEFDLGVTLGAYLPRNAYLMVATPSLASAAAAHPDVDWVGEWLPEYRVSNAVVEHALREIERQQTSSGDPSNWTGELRIELTNSKSATAQRTSNVAASLAIDNPDVTVETLDGRPGVIIASDVAAMDAASVAASLSNSTDVHFVTPRLEPKILNHKARFHTQQGATTFPTTGNPSIWQMGLKGAGQRVAVADTGLDEAHCAFADTDKVPLYHTFLGATREDTDGHGTHVSGTVLGHVDADATNSLNGMAPDAQLLMLDIGFGSFLFGIPDDMANTGAGGFFEVAYREGARIHTNSWGSNSLGGYTDTSQDTDEYTHTRPNMLVTIAAGNSGNDGVDTVGAPATSKNALTVGASENQNDSLFQNVAYFSSQGLTEDGRLKPEVIAPGYGVVSAATGTACGEANLSGTSMATPAVAGSAALVRQYLADGWYPTGVSGGTAITEPEG